MQRDYSLMGPTRGIDMPISLARISYKDSRTLKMAAGSFASGSRVSRKSIAAEEMGCRGEAALHVKKLSIEIISS
jgi:hypothetical protein